MLGKNHALFGVIGWIGLWPTLVSFPQIHIRYDRIDILFMTTLIVAGAAVIPDLDHHNSTSTKHLGILTKLVSKSVVKASGGHRQGTHSIFCCFLLTGITAATFYLPHPFNLYIIGAMCFFCTSVGLILIGPSLNFSIPFLGTAAIGGLVAWWIIYQYAFNGLTELRIILPVLAGYGVIIHIICDLVTKQGVPIFWPVFKKFRPKFKLFYTGGTGETRVALLGLVLLVAAIIRVAWPLISVSINSKPL